MVHIKSTFFVLRYGTTHSPAYDYSNSNSLNCSQCPEALITWDDIVPSRKQTLVLRWGCNGFQLPSAGMLFWLLQLQIIMSSSNCYKAKPPDSHNTKGAEKTTSNSPLFSRPGECHVERSQSHKLQGQRWREWRYHPQRTRSGGTDSIISNMKATNGSRKSSQKVSNLCWFHFPFRYWTWCWFYLPMRIIGVPTWSIPLPFAIQTLPCCCCCSWWLKTLVPKSYSWKSGPSVAFILAHLFQASFSLCAIYAKTKAARSAMMK